MHSYKVILGVVLFILSGPAWSWGSITGGGIAGPDAGPLPVQAQQGQELQGMLDEAQEAWDNRSEQESLERAIAIYERAMNLAAPDVQAQLAERIARGSYFLAYGFHQDDEELQQELYERGNTMAEACLMLDPAVQRAGDVEAAADQISEPYLGCAFWAATNLGKWANLQGLRSRMGERGKIVALVSRVEEMDPTYFHGAVDRFWGAYYAVLPGIMGGSLDKSREHFEQALEIEPDYLGTRVLMAEELATREGDRELYQRLLREVLDANPEALPDTAEENRIEQRRAHRLLQEIDEHF